MGYHLKFLLTVVKPISCRAQLMQFLRNLENGITYIQAEETENEFYLQIWAAYEEEYLTDAYLTEHYTTPDTV